MADQVSVAGKFDELAELTFDDIGDKVQFICGDAWISPTHPQGDTSYPQWKVCLSEPQRMVMNSQCQQIRFHCVESWERNARLMPSEIFVPTYTLH